MHQPLDRQRVASALRAFIATELMFEPDPDNLATDASLSALGVLDSTSVLELLAFIEVELHVAIALDAITSETFDSLDNITGLVMAHLSSHPTADTAGSASSDSP